jgi:CheY-like chemotaxis protein
MTGWELLAELEAAGRTLPVIMMTAYSEEPTPERARQARIVAYLCKPFDARVLLEALQRVPAQWPRGPRKSAHPPGHWP